MFFASFTRMFNNRIEWFCYGSFEWFDVFLTKLIKTKIWRKENGYPKEMISLLLRKMKKKNQKKKKNGWKEKCFYINVSGGWTFDETEWSSNKHLFSIRTHMWSSTSGFAILNGLFDKRTSCVYFFFASLSFYFSFYCFWLISFTFFHGLLFVDWQLLYNMTSVQLI